MDDRKHHGRIEWAGAPIDHPFHIHINPFQVTEVFDPNETVTDPSTNQPLPKYVFDPTQKKLPGQCVLDPNDPDTWKPCVENGATSNPV